MKRASILSLIFAAALIVSVARADDEALNALEACVSDAVIVLENSGGTPLSPMIRGFLPEGRSATHTFELPADGCVGFVAVGHARVQDIDLQLHTRGGVELLRDTSIDPYAYLRYCGGRGLRLVVSVLMYKGRGEYRLVAVTNAPDVLPDLNQKVGSCFASKAGMIEPPANVGPEPPGPSLPDAVRSLRRDLETLGYRPIGEERGGTLGRGQVAQETILLEGGRCYALAATGGPTATDVDLLVRGPGARSVGRDIAPRREAIVKLCPDFGGPHHLVVRMHTGSGDWALGVYVLNEPTAAPASIAGAARIAHAEMQARIEARGMRVEPLAWGYVTPGIELGIPVSLDEGRCYAFGAVPAEELAGADLDLVLVDADGARMAWDLGWEHDPLLFHCPERSGTYRVLGRVWGGRGRYLTLLGNPEGTP